MIFSPMGLLKIIFHSITEYTFFQIKLEGVFKNDIIDISKSGGHVLMHEQGTLI